MPCVGDYCGTGDWGGPLPGDPDNTVNLTATPAFGGIDVSWTMPLVNPFAVSYAVLYRSAFPDFATAAEHVRVGGNFFYDKVNTDTRYYYWLTIVSQNGTVGDLIGPATAIARPAIAQIIEELTDRIDNGMLAQALKTEIARIGSIDSAILDEIEDRLAANQLLADVLAEVQSEVGQAMTLVQSEITQRTEGDSALVDAINVMAAGVGPGVAAAILNERNLRVSADSALAADITTLFARVGSADAAIINEQTVRANADSAIALNVTTLFTRYEENRAAIETEQTTRSTADSAMASNISTLFTQVGAANAAIATEQTARATEDTAITTQMNTLYANVGPSINAAVAVEAAARVAADGVLASQITTTESALNGNIAAAQTLLQTNIDTVDGKATAIGALYTAKVTVNGLIGGFGVYNDGSEVQAGFDVDTFWVGRTSANKRKPFIIVGSETFIDEAVINKLTFSKLRDEGGSFVVADGKVKADYLNVKGLTVTNVGGAVSFAVDVNGDSTFGGTLNVKSGTSGERMEMTNQKILIYDAANVLRVKIGKLD